jgi:hypothetical protein
MHAPLRSIRHKLFNKCLDDLSPAFQELARTNFAKWQRDPHSVGWHRLTGMKSNLFSAEIGYSGRAVGLVTEDKGGKPVCIWLFVGTHEKYNNWIEVQRQRKAESYLSAVPDTRMAAQPEVLAKTPSLKAWRQGRKTETPAAKTPARSP